MRSILSSLAIASLSTIAVAQSPLTTLFASNNSGSVGGGVYFDVTVNVPLITITQVDLNLISAASTVGTIDVYTISGSRTANQTNQALWTGPSALGSAITAAGNNVPSVCTLSTPIVLSAGNWGIAFKANGVAHSYTNGTGANQTYSNAELSLAAGEASNLAFAAPLFTPRVVNCALHYSVGGSGTLLATATNNGQGCVSSFGSFYENFTAAASFDLSNTGMQLVNTGNGYLALPSTTAFVPPSGTATNLALGDDTETTVTLASTFNYPGGSTGTLTVCSNGYVSTATGNGTGFTPAVATMLNFANAAWGGWHDYLPNATNNVMFDQVGGVAIVTWNGVPDFGNAVPNTWQIQFNTTTGTVDFVWQQMSLGGAGHLVFFSPAGASVDPGNRDISATLPGTFQTGAADILPLSLTSSPRPIINTSINMDVGNIPAGSPFGAILVGFSNPGTDLTNIGMAGCTRYSDGLVSLLFVGPGSTASVPFAVPGLVGLVLETQAVVYAPAANLTLLGAIASNGRTLTCGDF